MKTCFTLYSPLWVRLLLHSWSHSLIYCHQCYFRNLLKLLHQNLGCDPLYTFILWLFFFQSWDFTSFFYPFVLNLPPHHDSLPPLLIFAPYILPLHLVILFPHVFIATLSFLTTETFHNPFFFFTHLSGTSAARSGQWAVHFLESSLFGSD